jgi:hypothetical protein
MKTFYEVIILLTLKIHKSNIIQAHQLGPGVMR